MSIKLISDLWSYQTDPTAKAVLICLADNANDSGYCWPSIGTICIKTCYKKDAVIMAIKRLEQSGILTANRESGRKTTYTIKTKPVGQTNQSARPTSRPNRPNQSAKPTEPVGQTDTNRKEPSKDIIINEKRISLDWTPPQLWRRDAIEAGIPPSHLGTVIKQFAEYWNAIEGASGERENWRNTWRGWCEIAAGRIQKKTDKSSSGG